MVDLQTLVAAGLVLRLSVMRPAIGVVQKSKQHLCLEIVENFVEVEEKRHRWRSQVSGGKEGWHVDTFV